MATKKVATKKIAAKKAIKKKAALKKAAPKKIKNKKSVGVKATAKKTIPKDIIPQSDAEETSPSGDCMCRQKRPNGKYFFFTLMQGRWVQASSIPFPTKELCEEVNC